LDLAVISALRDLDKELGRPVTKEDIETYFGKWEFGWWRKEPYKSCSPVD